MFTYKKSSYFLMESVMNLIFKNHNYNSTATCLTSKSFDPRSYWKNMANL